MLVCLSLLLSIFNDDLTTNENLKIGLFQNQNSNLFVVYFSPLTELSTKFKLCQIRTIIEATVEISFERKTKQKQKQTHFLAE